MGRKYLHLMPNFDKENLCKTMGSLEGEDLCVDELKDFIERLERNISLLKENVCEDCTCSDGVVKHLEGHLEVAKVQMKFIESLQKFSQSCDPKVEEAINLLNNKIYDYTTLYEEFAEPFDLWDCKLRIIAKSIFPDKKDLIRIIWGRQLQKKLAECSSPYPRDKLKYLLQFLQENSKNFIYPCQCFPVEFLIENLELIAAFLCVYETWIVDYFTALKLPTKVLLNIYISMMYKFVGPDFLTAKNRRVYFYNCLVPIFNDFIDDVNMKNTTSLEQKKIASDSFGIVCGILAELFYMPEQFDLCDTYKRLQRDLGDIVRKLND